MCGFTHQAKDQAKEPTARYNIPLYFLGAISEQTPANQTLLRASKRPLDTNLLRPPEIAIYSDDQSKKETEQLTWSTLFLLGGIVKNYQCYRSVIHTCYANSNTKNDESHLSSYGVCATKRKKFSYFISFWDNL